MAIGQTLRETGLPVAGAQRGQVLRLVPGQGMRLVVLRIVNGLLAVLAGGRLIRALLRVSQAGPAPPCGVDLLVAVRRG